MSIFDDDHTPPGKKSHPESIEWPKTSKSPDSDVFGSTSSDGGYQSPISTSNDTEESLWGSMFELDNPAPVEKERLEPMLGDFEPLDDNRNRNLSNALTGIQDEGPAERPQPKPERIREEVRNPFMSVTPEPSEFPAQEQPPKSTPEVEPERSRPEPQPTPPSSARPGIGYGQLLTWAGLALVLILGIWNIVHQSESDLQIKALTNSVDRLSQKIRVLGGDELDNLPPDLTPKLDALTNRVDRLSTQLGSVQSQQPAEPSLPTDLANQLSDLNKRLDLIENNLTAVQIAAAKPAQPQPAPEPAKAKPTPAPADNWYINIAVLSDKKNAVRLRDKARSLGTDTKVEPYPSQGKTLYRLRAYGYATQSDAEQDAQRLQSALNLSGLWIRERSKL